MRLVLHDHVPAAPDASAAPVRPTFPQSDRSTVLSRVLRWLGGAPRDARPARAAIRIGWHLLRVETSFHGRSVAAVWSAGAGEPVAASLILAGASAADDGAAIESLRRRASGLPFAADDYASVAARPRPCLGTLYVDSRWYDNGIIELAATSLALAVLEGPGAVLNEPDASGRTPPGVAGPPPFAGESRPRFTRERVAFVMGLVSRKVDAAVARVSGRHFKVYPPEELLADPFALERAAVFGRLGHTDWSVRWYDGREDRLTFAEFLAFLDQLIGVEKAFQSKVSGAAVAGHLLNDSVWQAPSPTGRRPMTVKANLVEARLGDDTVIRGLFERVELEPFPRTSIG